MTEPMNNRESNADLLGYHLGLTDEATKARVELEHSAQELAASRETVRRILAPLAADQVVETPPDLVDRIMARAEAAQATIPFGRPAPVLASEAGRGRAAGGPLMTFRELVGLAAAIILLAGVFVPGFRTARWASQQANCADHLRSIGNGYAEYAESYGNQLPFAGPVPVGASWLRTADPNVPVADNSRNVWRLVKERHVLPGVFVCPGRPGDKPVEAVNVEALEAFPNSRNNSYPTNFVAGPRTKDSLQENTPLAGDMNPLCEQPKPLIRASELPPNSRSHEPLRGQNVLYGNLTVRFVRTPNVGVDNDDIYRLIGVQEYTGRERPSLSSDVFLIP